MVLLVRVFGVVERRRRELSGCLISAPVADLGRGREAARAAQRWRAQRQRAAEHFVVQKMPLRGFSAFSLVGELRRHGEALCLAKERLRALPIASDCPNRSTKAMAAANTETASGVRH